MQHLEVSCAVRPLKWSLGVKWLIVILILVLLLSIELSLGLGKVVFDTLFLLLHGGITTFL